MQASRPGRGHRSPNRSGPQITPTARWNRSPRSCVS